MENTESDPASLGPRYAPDDPSLPKPWKGLIDGSSGVLYFWNPETNITQYEKPAGLPPPLPPGQPKLAPIPVAHSFPQNGEQMALVPQNQQQQQQHQMPPQQIVNPGQAMTQLHGGHMGQQVQGPTYQTQASQVAPPQGQPSMHQHMQYMHYQQSQGYAQPQPFASRQEFTPGFPKKEEDGFQNRNQNQNQTGFSPSQFQSQSLPIGMNPAQIRPVNQPQHQLSGNLNNMQQPTSMGQFQPRGPDLGHNPHSRFQAERGASAVHNQQPNMPPGGLALRAGHENSFHGRGGNDYAFSGNQEMPIGGPQQPQVAAIPSVRAQQELRFSGVPYPNAMPGQTDAFNNGAGHNMHSHATGGQPFLSSAMMKPAFRGPPDVSSFSSVESYRHQHEVTASGDNVPAPFMTFESTGFSPEILREFSLVAGAISAPKEEHMSYAALMYSAGFSTPTPIQAQTWPIALQSRDIVAIAKTGSGKTLGYLIPAFILLMQRHNNALNGPTVLVLAPTRELATQIQEEVIKFGRSSRVSCTCLYGGASKGAQLKDLERGADIVVATPGRLNDILEMKKIDFRQVSLLVLDEADRMLDMGFEPQIRKIVNEIPPRRQTLMFTATWPKEVRKIASDLLVSPVQVNIGKVDELSANKAITQYVEVVPPMEKQRRLEQILRSQERGSKVIIFCSTKRLCDQIARTIARNFGAAAIHGDKSQGERDWVLSQFRCGKSPILVATDVAARGLDIKDIRVVINYDFPTGIEDYVHRIGRTGRAGATGLSYTFFSEQDWKYAPDLIKLLEGANQRVPQDVRDIAVRGGAGFGKDRRFDPSSGIRGGGGFAGRGGRDGNFSGGRGFGGRGDFSGGRGGGYGGGRGDFSGGRAVADRFGGGGQGRGRFDNRRGGGGGGGRNYSRSPERVRTWGYSRSESSSRSRSRSRSRSPRRRTRSRSRGRDRSRSRSRSYNRRDSPRKRESSDKKDSGPKIPDLEAAVVDPIPVVPQAGEQSEC